MSPDIQHLFLRVLFYGVHVAVLLLGLRAGRHASAAFAGRKGFFWAVPGIVLLVGFAIYAISRGFAVWGEVFYGYLGLYFAPLVVVVPALFLTGRWLGSSRSAA
ncbi:MAG: hypothetical protein AAGA87_07905 [Pseudomonadota bacterium]